MDSTIELERNFSSFIKAIKIQSECVDFPVCPPKHFNYEEWKSNKLAWETNKEERIKLLEQEQRLLLEQSQKKTRKSVLAKSAVKTVANGSVIRTRSSKKQNDDNVVVIENFNRLLKPIIQRLPDKYKEPTHKKAISAILKSLAEKREGLYYNEISSSLHLAKAKCSEYMNMLVKNGDVLKFSRKGLLYQMNWDRHSSSSSSSS